MFSRKVTQAILVTSFAASSVGVARQDDWSMNNRWTVTADWIYSIRRTLNSKKVVERPAAVRNTGNKRKNYLNRKRALRDFDFESGYLVGLRYDWTCEHTFEGKFMHTGKWEGSSHISAYGDLYYPFKMKTSSPGHGSYILDTTFSHDFTNASRAKVSYSSQLDSAEVNWVYHLSPERENYFGVGTLLGLRYFCLEESFTLAMQRPPNRSTYDINTSDNLFGGQAGLNLQWNPLCCLSWDLMPRLGFFNNNVKQSTHLRDYNNTVTLSKYSRSGTNLSYLAELIVKGSYQLGRYFNVHAGYQFLYLDKLGLAPEQTAFNVATHSLAKKINREGTAFIGSWFAGVNFSF